jgi:hypothetical protein
MLSRRTKCVESKSWCLGMLFVCLIFSSLRLGVPFIAPRQLGAVESIPGRLILPSVDLRTGQSGAPPDIVRCGSLSLFGEADRWRLGAVGAPDSPVPPPDRWLGHVSRADRATDRWPGRPLAHRTVRCTPDSPVNYSHTPLISSRDQQVRLSQPGAPDTVWCTQTALTLAENLAISSPTRFFQFPALRHNTLVHKAMY